MDVHVSLQVISLKPVTTNQTNKFYQQKKRIKDWAVLEKRMSTNCNIKQKIF